MGTKKTKLTERKISLSRSWVNSADRFLKFYNFIGRDAVLDAAPAKLYTRVYTKMIDTTCIRCKFFRMQNSTEGTCRKLSQQTVSKSDERKQRVKIDYSCEQWQDCGQQYYIRLGWIKGQAKQEGPDNRQWAENFFLPAIKRIPDSIQSMTGSEITMICRIHPWSSGPDTAVKYLPRLSPHNKEPKAAEAAPTDLGCGQSPP